jgi:hypothetical protein
MKNMVPGAEYIISGKIDNVGNLRTLICTDYRALMPLR